MKLNLKQKLTALLLVFVMLAGLTACGKDEEEAKKRDKYKDVSAYELAMAAVNSQDNFAEGAIETFDLTSPDNRDTYFELCYDVENFSESGIAEDFSYIGCSVGNADEVAVAVVPKKSKRDTVEEMFRFRMDSRIEAFTGYAPEQVQKLKKGKILTYDEYIIFLVCDDVESAEEAIRQMLTTGKAEPKNGNQSTPAPTPVPSEQPTAEPSQEPTPTPTFMPEPKPTAVPVDPNTVYYRGKFEGSYNPVLPEAIRTGHREMLTDEQDLKLYDYCRDALTKIFNGKSMTEFEAEKAIYKYVVDYVSYDYGHYSLEGQQLNSDNPYGAFFTGLGICTGYSSSFRLLCESVGIVCIEVDGTAFREREAHGWNMVKLGPYWYYVDPCWGWNGSGRVNYGFLNVTERYMTETEHYWDKEGLPEADTMSYTERKKAGYGDQEYTERVITFPASVQ